MNGKRLGVSPQNRFFELLHISPEINYPDECIRNVSADTETSERTEDGFANLAYPMAAIHRSFRPSGD